VIGWGVGGSTQGALSHGHPDAKARHQDLFFLPSQPISRQSRFIPIFRAAHLRMDSQRVNAAVNAPSGLRQLLGCVPPEMPALKLSLRISSGCALCDLPPLQFHSPVGDKEMAVLGASGPAALVWGGRGLTAVNSDKLQSSVPTFSSSEFGLEN